MNIQNVILGKRYAVAFLNFYISSMDNKIILNLYPLIDFLKKKQEILLFFSLPNLSLSDKNNFIDMLFAKFQISQEFKKIIILLIKQNRISLLPDVLKSLIDYYQIKRNLVIFDVYTPVYLENSDLDILKSFLKNKINKEVILVSKIDKSLIAGIKIQSYTLYLEFSVKKQLGNIKKLIYEDLIINGN